MKLLKSFQVNSALENPIMDANFIRASWQKMKDDVETANSVRKIDVALFNFAEEKVLEDIHKRIVDFGGVIDITRFGEIFKVLANNNGEGDTPEETLRRLFKACDNDTDGIINFTDWLILFTILFRINPKDISSIIQAREVRSSELFQKKNKKNNQDQDAHESREIKTTPIIRKPLKIGDTKKNPESIKNHENKRETPPPSVAVPQKQQSSQKNFGVKVSGSPPPRNNPSPPPGPPCKFPGSPYLNSRTLSHPKKKKSPEQVLAHLKKTALIKMTESIQNKVLLHRLWDAVSDNDNLIRAWATSLLPTSKLIATSKAIADVRLRGHSSWSSSTNTNSQKGNSTSSVFPNSDRELLRKHEKLMKAYGFRRFVGVSG